MSTADVTGDYLDLKAEVTSLKNKLFMADQKRTEELTIKNVELAKVELLLKEEQRRAQEEISKRDKRIKDMERNDKSAADTKTL
jgi:hypothetical protein